MDENFSESIGKHVFGEFRRPITNVWHQDLTLEASSNSIIDTLWFTPVWLSNKKKKVNDSFPKNNHQMRTFTFR